MDAKEISELYGRMVGACRKEESDAECGAWKEVLGVHSRGDLDAACRRWIADTEVEQWTGKPRGSRMPSAAELKISIERFNRASGNKFMPCGKCDWGWVRVTSGKTVGTEDAAGTLINPRVGAVRRCQCFKEWAEQRKSA